MYVAIIKGQQFPQVSYQQTLVDVLWALLVAKSKEVVVYNSDTRTTLKRFHNMQEWTQEYGRLFADIPVVLNVNRIQL